MAATVNVYQQYTQGVPLPSSIGQVISILLPNAIVLAGLIFFSLILFGGYSLIVSAGRDNNPQSAARGKQAVTYGVIGFLLVVTAYFILQIAENLFRVNLINPSFVP